MGKFDKIELVDGGEKLSLEEIERFMKSDEGVLLPDDYVEFLLCMNGGSPPWNQGLEMCIVYERNMYSGINVFYPFDFKAQHNYFLPNKWYWWKENFSSLFFPIADDGSGDFFLLGVHPKIFGKVFYGYHERLWFPEEFSDDEIIDNIERMRIVHAIADDFLDFIDKLEVQEFEDDE